MNAFLRAAWMLPTAVLLGGAAGSAMAQGSLEEGKALFTKGAVPACAVCHTLAHAGAAGEIGPVLDELRPNAARVEKAVRNGIGQMPAYTSLSDSQIKQLAEYVSKVTGAAN
jgi:mono/diheme cytochrome c family protein